MGGGELLIYIEDRDSQLLAVAARTWLTGGSWTAGRVDAGSDKLYMLRQTYHICKKFN